MLTNLGRCPLINAIYWDLLPPLEVLGWQHRGGQFIFFYSSEVASYLSEHVHRLLHIEAPSYKQKRDSEWVNYVQSCLTSQPSQVVWVWVLWFVWEVSNSFLELWRKKTTRKGLVNSSLHHSPLLLPVSVPRLAQDWGLPSIHSSRPTIFRKH